MAAAAAAEHNFGGQQQPNAINHFIPLRPLRPKAYWQSAVRKHIFYPSSTCSNFLTSDFQQLHIAFLHESFLHFLNSFQRLGKSHGGRID
jgi:hypothetical protein